jgi:tripartite-type tricarboxylate transporter receptor subunit TctC
MKRVLALFFAAAVSLSGHAQAQAPTQHFPDRPVTMVIPFPAGAGANDILGRFMAERLARIWGRPVVVDNRPGANSTIGAMAVIRARPDGHTMMFTSANYTMTPAVADIPFDAKVDLRPAGIIGLGEYLLITGQHMRINNAQDFIAEARKRELTYAGGTPGADLAAELFMKAAGVRMLRVPYRGTNDAAIDLLAGRIDFVVAAVGAQVDAIARGDVRAIAVTGANRSPLLPNVPTLREQGLASAELPTWWGIMLPGKTPDAIVAKINADIATVLQEPETRAFFAQQSVVPTSMSPQEMSTLINNEIDKFIKLAEQAGYQRN